MAFDNGGSEKMSNMGIDLLDIVYRLEKAFSIKIDRDDFFPFDVFNDKQSKYVVNGELTTLGLEKIKQRIPSADFSSLEKKPIIQNLATILTVGALCDLVENKIRAKNKGIDTFPNISLQISHSVPKTLAKCFNIADSSRVIQEMRLEQLAGLSDTPLPKNFWRRFYKICRGDPDKLKTIKVCVRSRELVSTWKTFCWSFVITLIWALVLYLGSTVWLCCNALGSYGTLWIDDVRLFLTVLFIPGFVLFGFQFAVNWNRCGQAPRMTVAEIIHDIGEQRTDRSVRADGLPYSRKEIENRCGDSLRSIGGQTG